MILLQYIGFDSKVINYLSTKYMRYKELKVFVNFPFGRFSLKISKSNECVFETLSS